MSKEMKIVGSLDCINMTEGQGLLLRCFVDVALEQFADLVGLVDSVEGVRVDVEFRGVEDKEKANE